VLPAALIAGATGKAELPLAMHLVINPLPGVGVVAALERACRTTGRCVCTATGACQMLQDSAAAPVTLLLLLLVLHRHAAASWSSAACDMA
jgi:hypothetical protein